MLFARKMEMTMKKQEIKPSKKGLYASLAGTVLVALCCFTPVLVIGLSAVGLKLFVPYLDYVLLPAMVLMIIYSFYSYKKWKQECKSCSSQLK